MRFARKIERIPWISLLLADIKAAKRIRLSWWLIVGGIAAVLPAVALLDRMGRINYALPLLNSVLVWLFLLHLKRKLWCRWWFWLCVGAFGIGHVLLVWAVPWGSEWVPAAVYAGGLTIDLIGMLSLLAVIETAAGRGEVRNIGGVGGARAAERR